MLDEATFRRHAEAALESLRKALVQTESDVGFEVEEQDGALNITFDDAPSKLVVAPNTAVRQIWISVLSTHLILDWDPAKQSFVLAKTDESLKPLVARLITEQLGGGEILLN